MVDDLQPADSSARDEFATTFQGGAVRIASSSPHANVPTIHVFPQSDGEIDRLAGPIAAIFYRGHALYLWPMQGLGSDDPKVARAWQHLPIECRTYFNPRGTPEDNWAYARYHCGTVSNLVSATRWVKCDVNS